MIKLATTVRLRASESTRTSRRASKVVSNAAVSGAVACLANCKIGLAYVDAALRLVYCNPAFEQLCDTSARKLSQMPLAEIIPFLGDLSVLTSGKQNELSICGLLTRGADAPVRMCATLCADKTGGGFTVMLSPEITSKPAVVPATERPAAEPPSRRSSQPPEERDHFLAVLEHELRNPLTPILAWAEVLKQEPNQTHQMRRAVSAIERSVLQQRALVDDLLDLASIHNGNLRCEQLPVQIHAVLAESVAHFEACAKEKGIAVVFNSSAADAIVCGDRRRLAQVFDNLLDNAVKFTPPGGRIEVHMASLNGRVRIDISDSGIGIAPDFMSELFKTFTQAHPLASRYRRGLGLGLALVKNLIDRHHGEVQAASAGENMGTVFSVFLPLQTPDAIRPAAAVSATRGKVLIVEDRDDTREALRTLIESWGFEVAEAPDGIAGLKVIAEFEPNLVLCDLSMPVMDGWEMASQLRAQVPSAKMPMVALSGHGTPSDIQRSLDAGFQAHVVKPCEAKVLLSVLKQFLPAASIHVTGGQN